MDRYATVVWLGLGVAVMALGLGLAALILALDDDGPGVPVVARQGVVQVGPTPDRAPRIAPGPAPDQAPRIEPRPAPTPAPEPGRPDVAPQPQPAQAQLGVQVDPGQEGLTVMAVLPGSAAEAAGVVEGDVITAIDGDAVQSVAEARAALAAHAPDAVLELEVLREGERQVLRVELPTVATPRLDESPFDFQGPLRAFAGPQEVTVRQGTVREAGPAALTLDTVRGAVTFDVTDDTVFVPQGQPPVVGDTAFVLAAGDAAVVVWVAAPGDGFTA